MFEWEEELVSKQAQGRTPALSELCEVCWLMALKNFSWKSLFIIIIIIFNKQSSDNMLFSAFLLIVGVDNGHNYMLITFVWDTVVLALSLEKSRLSTCFTP